MVEAALPSEASEPLLPAADFSPSSSRCRCLVSAAASCWPIAQWLSGGLGYMILMMALIGCKTAGNAGGLAAAGAKAAPPCTMYFVGYRLWDRFRDAPWQKVVRAGLAPLTFGLIVAAAR
jgi:hypothetical protein